MQSVYRKNTKNAKTRSCANICGTFIPVTISVGCAVLSETARGQLGELVAIADERLYRAKHMGRNRVVAMELDPSVICEAPW